MTPEMYALGLRARNAKGFRWMWGMAASAPGWLDDARIIEVEKVPYLWEYRGYLRGREKGDEWDADLVPALDDAATLGCLLALVREAWGAKNVHLVRTIDNGWRVYDLPGKASDDASRCYGATEAEALVAALEAAP